MANGLTPCTANIKGAGVCDREVWDRVLAAALGGPCVVTTGPVPHSVTLNWTVSTSPNLKGYNVYRSATSGGPYAKVNSALILGGSTTTYTDTTVLAGLTYYYVATAVDNSDNESAYSNEAQAVIPTP